MDVAGLARYFQNAVFLFNSVSKCLGESARHQIKGIWCLAPEWKSRSGGAAGVRAPARVASGESARIFWVSLDSHVIIDKLAGNMPGGFPGPSEEVGYGK